MGKKDKQKAVHFIQLDGQFLPFHPKFYSFFNCSLEFTDEASEFVPLGLRAWKEKSISPTRVLTCLRSALASGGASKRQKRNQQNPPNKLLNIRRNTPATNLNDSKSAILGLHNMPDTQDTLIDGFQPARERERLRELQVGRQGLAVAQAGRE